MGELSTLQLIIIGIGALIALPVVFDFFKGVSLPSAPKSKAKTSTSITVSQWEALYSSCKDLCLTDACDKLDEVFPLLVKRDKICLEEREDEIEILED